MPNIRHRSDDTRAPAGQEVLTRPAPAAPGRFRGARSHPDHHRRVGRPGQDQSVTRTPKATARVFPIAYGWFAAIVRNEQLIALECITTGFESILAGRAAAAPRWGQGIRQGDAECLS